MHPPIDSVLLKNLHKEHKHLKTGNIIWTILTEEKYFELIGKLRRLEYNAFWELEKFWNPVQNELQKRKD